MKNQTQIERKNNNINSPVQRRKRAGARLARIPLANMDYLETHDPKDIAAKFYRRRRALSKKQAARYVMVQLTELQFLYLNQLQGVNLVERFLRIANDLQLLRLMGDTVPLYWQRRLLGDDGKRLHVPVAILIAITGPTPEEIPPCAAARGRDLIAAELNRRGLAGERIETRCIL